VPLVDEARGGVELGRWGVAAVECRALEERGLPSVSVRGSVAGRRAVARPRAARGVRVAAGEGGGRSLELAGVWPKQDSCRRCAGRLDHGNVDGRNPSIRRAGA
jgi:hypothetical protein